MPKTISRIVCSILIMLVMIMTLSACAAKGEPRYAGSITEGILLGMNEDDYAKFSENFDDTMKKAIPETTFKQLTTNIKAAIGDYAPASKKFWKVITSGIYTDVYYKAEFTQKPEVVVHVSFHESEGEIYVNGLWFE